MRFWKHFWKREKMSKNEPNLRRFLEFFEKILSSQRVFSILQFRALWSHFHFSLFYVFFPKSCSGFHFWTFLKCPFLRISENSSNKVNFCD